MVTLSENTKTIASVERSIAIIESLREHESATVGELAQAMDLSKSSVHSHLATLQKEGYVVREGDLHRLSLRFLSHGEFVKTQIPMFDIIKEHVQNLAKETGENVSVVVEEQGEGVFVYCENSNHKLPATRVGNRIPIHCTSAGKAILAGLADEQVDHILKTNPLCKLTDNTIVDQDELRAELEEVREQGFAINHEERIPRLQSVAVSITDHNSAPVCAIAVAGPKHRMKRDRLQSEIPDALLVAADKIELNALSE